MVSTYIGMTTQPLANRLTQHNSGIGALSTSDPQKRPWACVGFVIGFDNDVDVLRDFEKKWKKRRDVLISRNHCELSSEAIVNIGTEMTSWNEYVGFHLKMVRTCEIISRL